MVKNTIFFDTVIHYTFCFEEYEYEAILPTPSLSTSVHTLQLGGRQTEVR